MLTSEIFVLSKQCKWGKPGDEIEVSTQVANRLKKDGFGDRKSDIETLTRAKAKVPDAYAAVEKATREAEAEVEKERLEAEEKDRLEREAKAKADEKASAGAHSNAKNKGPRQMATG